MSQIGEAHFEEYGHQPRLLDALYRRLPWWFSLDAWRTRRVVVLIHIRDSAGPYTHEMSGWFLDMEIHDGQLVFVNAHDEEFRTPADGLMTLEIR